MFFKKKNEIADDKVKPVMIRMKHGDHRVGRCYNAPRLRRANKVEALIIKEAEKYKKEEGIIFPLVWMPIVFAGLYLIVFTAGIW